MVKGKICRRFIPRHCLLVAFWVRQKTKEEGFFFLQIWSLDKQEFTAHYPIVKTDYRPHTASKEESSLPPMNILKHLAPRQDTILQKLKRAYLYSTGVNHWQYQLLEHWINTNYKSRLCSQSSCGEHCFQYINQQTKLTNMLYYLRPHGWKWSNTNRSHASSIQFSALSTKILK